MDKNSLSEQDKNTNKESGTTGYLTTPNGSPLEYDPISDQASTIAIDLPSDPNDPTPKKEVNSVYKAKEETKENTSNETSDVAQEKEEASKLKRI